MRVIIDHELRRRGLFWKRIEYAVRISVDFSEEERAAIASRGFGNVVVMQLAKNSELFRRATNITIKDLIEDQTIDVRYASFIQALNLAADVKEYFQYLEAILHGEAQANTSDPSPDQPWRNAS